MSARLIDEALPDHCSVCFKLNLWSENCEPRCRIVAERIANLTQEEMRALIYAGYSRELDGTASAFSLQFTSAVFVKYLTEN